MLDLLITTSSKRAALIHSVLAFIVWSSVI